MWKSFKEARKLFPDAGHPYRLFDNAVVLAGVSLLWYLLSVPSEVTNGAIGETILSGPSIQVWGIIMLVVAVAALVMIRIAHGDSTKSNWVDYGYAAVMLVTGLWSIALVTGGLGGYLFGDLSWDSTAKVLGSGLWFAYACSNTTAAFIKEQTVNALKKRVEELELELIRVSDDE